VAQLVKRLPLGQFMILGAWDWAPHPAPSEKSASPSPLSPHLCSLSLSQINKTLKKERWVKKLWYINIIE